MGCDVSEKRVGIADAGEKAFIAALRAFDHLDPSSLGQRSFSRALLAAARSTCQENYSEDNIVSELNRVSDFFLNRGTYYYISGNMRSLRGTIVESANCTTLAHMRGNRDPKTRLPFSEEQSNLLNSTKVHNLLHNSEANADKIDGVLLPPGKACVNDCIMDELKKMVIARGGNLMGQDGKAIPSNQLKRLVRANLLLEKKNSKHTVYFQP